MALEEGGDVVKDGVLFHEDGLLRVITRTSTLFAGDYTILPPISGGMISALMDAQPSIDIERLEADMAECVERTSARAFSLKATGGKNPDFYRNWVNNGQNKRLSANVFAGIVSALERDPARYIVGIAPFSGLPSATVLTSAMAALLETVGIDPFEDERAQKLARRFPDALRRSSTLHAGLTEEQDSLPGEASPDRGADRSVA